jgi:transketolase
MLLLKVDNLIATIDLNGKQIDGATDEVLPMGSIRAKFEAFDWDVLDIEGNNIEAIIAGMTEAKSEQEKENQFVCCILKWEWGGFHDEYSCLAWKST